LEFSIASIRTKSITNNKQRAPHRIGLDGVREFCGVKPLAVRLQLQYQHDQREHYDDEAQITAAAGDRLQ
jgi:hypothetical protein